MIGMESHAFVSALAGAGAGPQYDSMTSSGSGLPCIPDLEIGYYAAYLEQEEK